MQSTQAVIILLLVANLVATIWFGLNESTIETLSRPEKAVVHELPQLVDSKVIDLVYSQFVTAFNARDYEAMYKMLGPEARSQVSEESVVFTLKKMVEHFHSIEGGSFTHSELAGTHGNTSYYSLHYAVEFAEDRVFGTQGELKITLAVQGDEYYTHTFSIGTE